LYFQLVFLAELHIGVAQCRAIKSSKVGSENCTLHCMIQRGMAEKRGGASGPVS